MHELIFQPFIGKDYKNSLNKILILGESHYCGEGDNCCFKLNNPACFNFTLDVLARYLNYKQGKHHYERWMTTFTRFSNIFNGKKLNNIETVNFWNTVTFYNYVQFPTELPRQSPSNGNFTKSYYAFEKVVKSISPDLIIFWGDRMWNKFPKAKHIVDEVDHYKINILELNKKLPFIVIPHPSSSKLSYSYSEVLENFINASVKYSDCLVEN